MEVIQLLTGKLYKHSEKSNAVTLLTILILFCHTNTNYCTANIVNTLITLCCLTYFLYMTSYIVPNV